MSFSVGQKATLTRQHYFLELDDGSAPINGAPTYGEVYMVAAINFHAGMEWLFFEEFPKSFFWSAHFRPVVEPKVELPECLTALLDPHKQFEDAR